MAAQPVSRPPRALGRRQQALHDDEPVAVELLFEPAAPQRGRDVTRDVTRDESRGGADEQAREKRQRVQAARAGLEQRGWVLGPPDGGFGGYQNVVLQPHPGGRWTYGAATEMRKDGVALAY
mgnify:CR=1 FL=1